MTEVAPKDPDQAATYSLVFLDDLVPVVERRRAYALNQIVQAPIDTGFLYVCTTAGNSAAIPPKRWPKVSDGTVQDGSAVFTAKHPADVTENIIDSASWDVPAGLTLDSQEESGYEARATLSGGTDGEDYDVVCTMTPVTGNPVDKTITVPVRSQ